MPWEHCGSALADDASCPGCGIRKEAWTVEFDVTRTFKVTRRSAHLRLALLDAAGQPVVDEPYRVTLPEGAVVEGRLDEFGTARVSAVEGATCRAAFPARERGQVARATSLGDEPAEDRAPGETSSTEPEDEDAGWPDDCWIKQRIARGDRSTPALKPGGAAGSASGASSSTAVAAGSSPASSASTSPSTTPPTTPTSAGPDAAGAFACAVQTARHVFRVGFPWVLIAARQSAVDETDRYTLASDGGDYRCERALAQAERTPDGHLVLWFEPPVGERFTLTVRHGSRRPWTLFRDQPLVWS